MLGDAERQAINRLWARKKAQEKSNAPPSERHRNLEPTSAEFLNAMATGLNAARLLEIGGSSGISTIALAAAARATGGTLVTIELEPTRQAESKDTIAALGLSQSVDFILGDATDALPSVGERDFIFIDCEKGDYIRFFDMLQMDSGAVVVADNILSHGLVDYVRHVRRRSGAESITVPIGQGLEVTRLP